MLASMTSPLPLREQPHLDGQHSTHNSSDSVAIEDRLCPGCKKSAVNEQGGLVVAFGQSFFHVACFKCAKCSNRVTADTNLLLLSDGSPICANCSYNCNVCHQPILDEAIMTGDDSYHAHCFKCKVCKTRIDELVFAKTSQGIYCMKCHNERMIKIRKYTQKKAERERNGGSGSSRTRDRDARNYHQDSASSNPGYDSLSRPSSSKSNGNLSSAAQHDTSRPSTARSTDSSAYARPAVKPKGPPNSQNGSLSPQPNSQSSNISTTMHLHSPSFSPSFPSNPAVTVAPPPETERPNPAKSSTLPVPPPDPNTDPDGRRRSYDDGVRPLHVLFGQKPTSNNATLRPDTGPSMSEGLTVTSRQEKRRSINPGLVLPNFSAALPSMNTNATLSPVSATFSAHSPALPGGSEPPLSRGGQGEVSRPTSQGSSIHSYHSFVTSTEKELTRSRSSSVATLDNEDRTVVLKPSQSRSREPSRSPSPAVHTTTSQIDGPGSRSHPQVNGNRLSSTSNLSAEERGSAVSSRSNSPYHQIDVPRGIEDGSDSDAAGEAASPMPDHRRSLPPIPPPKSDDDELDVQSPVLSEGPDASVLSQQDVSDDMSESSPVERTSHATFIAPALPPIRFSMTGSDFSELLNSVQGPSPLKSLDGMAALLQETSTEDPFVPPKTSSEATLAATPSPPLTADEHTPRRQTKTSATEERAVFNKPLEVRKKSSAENGPLPALNPPPNPIERKPSKDELKPTNDSQTTIAESSPGQPTPRRSGPDSIAEQLREAFKGSQEHGAKQIRLDVDFVEAIIATLDSRKAAYGELKEKFDGMKRTSKNFIDGVYLAQAEYDKEQKARRDAEAEVTRLRVLLSGQAAKLTAMSSEDRRHEVRQQISKELNDSLSGLEHDLSRLKLERDMALAEMEELSSTKSLATPEKPAVNLGRSITKRLDTLKRQYQRELVPLTEERETLAREIAELKAIRDMFLEETTALNARNEELAQLSHIYSRRLEAIPEAPLKQGQSGPGSRPSFERPKAPGHISGQSLAPSLSASTSGSSTLTVHDDSDRYMKPPKSDVDMHTPRKLKWIPSNKPKAAASPASVHDSHRSKGHLEHHFQQVSVLRFTRCDHCGDKLWGSQLRCTICHVSIHVRCVTGVLLSCASQQKREDTQAVLVPSMFGRDLVEQVQADSQGDDRQVPIIVEKCIQAVEAMALDYEGIYRKTGGSSQSKMITQLFERGDYTTFDLFDTDRFNDICSVTSVLKNYFRSLPNPLLTFELYEQFVQGVAIKDIAIKNRTLADLVRQLPSEHYYTLRSLMIHLNHIHEHNENNLMTARNLGVVFGPTLIKSPDPGAEFGDMAQRALFVEWLIENAPQLFNEANLTPYRV
ncbi:RhoGAP-domain-containing protein [Macrolepiota fuliginosa MF-IS2]|uniref:RhoGAP-domain-containing protein n=1 Tax=Macrolepiota fuliginosa MF-IS2 TaxID=1400762 RepID=A0A9P5XMM5_9AGAR|nr:RhoGAP-domain-containing protein [Macrolepiota fuliginosa MF-IS2]